MLLKLIGRCDSNAEPYDVTAKPALRPASKPGLESAFHSHVSCKHRVEMAVLEASNLLYKINDRDQKTF